MVAPRRERIQLGRVVEGGEIFEPESTLGHGFGESGGGSWMEKDLKTFLVV